MTNSPDYIEYLLEQMASLGSVEAKRMFGGHGIYCNERMFALVADDTLYLKVDAQNRNMFEAEGLEPFRFETKNGETAVMSYWEAPGAALDDQDILLEWSRYGVEASLRAPAKKKKPKRPKK